MNTASFTAIVLALGGLLPLLTAVIQQPKWSSRTRAIMSVCVSILAGLVAYVSQFGFDLKDVPTAVATIVGVILASNTAYKTIWQPVGATEAIEAATSPKYDETAGLAALEADVYEAPAEDFNDFTGPTDNTTEKEEHVS